MVKSADQGGKQICFSDTMKIRTHSARVGATHRSITHRGLDLEIVEQQFEHARDLQANANLSSRLGSGEPRFMLEGNRWNHRTSLREHGGEMTL